MKYFSNSTLLATAAATLLSACGTPNKPVTTTTPQQVNDAVPALAQTAPPSDLLFPEEAFRKTRPEPTTPRPFGLPQPKTFSLPGNISVILVERPKLPTVSLELTFAGGAMTDPKNKSGLAEICMDLLTEGTEKLDKVSFSEALADTASNISSYAGDDRQSVSMSSLKKHFLTTFTLFAEVLTKPGFRQADFDRLVTRQLEALKQAKASPSSVAARLWKMVFLGKNHPLGKVTTEQSIGAVKLADCVAYHKNYIKPQNASLFVVGDVTEDDIKAAFTPLLTAWNGAPKKIPALKSPTNQGTKIYFVDVPGAAQSAIGVWSVGPKRVDPEYFANQLLAQILGGGFSSRINMNLREDKGYSYGARANFSYNQYYGTLGINTSVRSDATAQSVAEIIAEARRLKDGSGPASEAELKREIDGNISSLPASFETGSDILEQYRTLAYFKLPKTYYETYTENVAKVTAAQIATAGAKWLSPNRSAILIVGAADAPQVKRDDTSKKDIPMMKSGTSTQATLWESLQMLVNDDRLGKATLIRIDADGNLVK